MIRNFTDILKKNWLGIVFCLFFAIISYFIAKNEICKSINLNSLTIAIIVGMVIGNFFLRFIPRNMRYGITFSGKKLLRIAIILYGFRITFQQIFEVGGQGFIADLIMLTSTYLLGYYIGTRVLKLDKDLCMLTSIGSSVCGAAAVLGTDSMLKAKSHKVSLAVSTVVLFGTISMFLYPVLYNFGILPENVFGIYIGSTIHEVAQVVASGSAISPTVVSTAVIVKLTRVMMLVPYLFLLGWYLAKKSNTERTKVPMPWFAILFVVMCGINSLNIIPARIVSGIVEFDVLLLTLAMFALGVETNFEKIKGLGIKPILLALIMFIWLVCFGWFVSHLFA
jgi:uncharacterized integral membrane protein (TIGR00698 family)